MKLLNAYPDAIDSARKARDAQKLREVIEARFPLPAIEVLWAEAAAPLPFAFLGVRGGYGETRAALKVAIESNRGPYPPQSYFDEVTKLYHALIAEGVKDDAADPDVREMMGTDKPVEIAKQLADRLATL